MDVITIVTIESENELAVVLGPALGMVIATFKDVVGFSRTAIPSL